MAGYLQFMSAIMIYTFMKLCDPEATICFETYGLSWKDTESYISHNTTEQALLLAVPHITLQNCSFPNAELKFKLWTCSLKWPFCVKSGIPMPC